MTDDDYEEYLDEIEEWRDDVCRGFVQQWMPDLIEMLESHEAAIIEPDWDDEKKTAALAEINQGVDMILHKWQEQAEQWHGLEERAIEKEIDPEIAARERRNAVPPIVEETCDKLFSPDDETDPDTRRESD